MFHFFGKDCWSEMLLPHQQACHSLTSHINHRVSGNQIALSCAFWRNRKSFPLISFLPFLKEQEVCSITHRGCEEAIHHTQWRETASKEQFEILQNNKVKQGDHPHYSFLLGLQPRCKMADSIHTGSTCNIGNTRPDS